MDEALSSYDILKEAEVSLIGDGLINETWKVKNCDAWFILQRINTTVFKNPQQIDSNLKLLAEYLSVYQTNYSFTAPVPNLEGKTMVCVTNQQYFRVFKFVPDSLCYSTIDNPQLAHEAAKQFGLFTSMLAAFPVDQLSYTIPDFHNLPLRHQSFVNAVNLRQYPDRLELATKAIELVNKYEYLVDIYTSDVLGNDKFVKRVCHHDTKISNVLFSKSNEGLCVIDLDTVMPGYYISDIGDMFRTYLCADSEEAVLDLDNCIESNRIRLNYFAAVVSGYLTPMKSFLSETEKKYVVYAGKYMIYMQAVRFLTDFLNGDVYYKVLHPLHNFNRAVNQLVLLEE